MAPKKNGKSYRTMAHAMHVVRCRPFNTIQLYMIIHFTIHDKVCHVSHVHVC